MTEPRQIYEDETMVRAEYPRPQWQRSEWMCLNGSWEFAFDFGNSGRGRGMVGNGEYPHTILVPFCPESRLSGIGYVDFMQAVWYRRTLTVNKPEGKRALLHFGAVDYECEVWLNGISCGGHKGGYTSFTLDVTDALRDGENVLVVNAQDDFRNKIQPFGKQKAFDHQMCAYTRTTGIYQTVWMEFVPEKYLSYAKMTPNAADGILNAEIHAVGTESGDRVRLTAYYDGREVGTVTASFAGTMAVTSLKAEEIHLWEAGAPELYDLKLELISGDVTEDTVESYFALRDISLTNRELRINGKPVFMRLVLDQGFNPEGIYTAPSDEFLKRDIELAMELGFNGARLHQRAFEERTLYWADKLGYLVWDEFATCFNLDTAHGLSCAEGIQVFLPEWLELMQRDFNHPSLIGWAPFCESYHEMILDPNSHRVLYQMTKAYDPTRPVIDASGGMHYDTDMFDVHDYEQNPEVFRSYFEPMKEDETAFHCPIGRYVGNAPRRPIAYKGQPYWVSECGGTYWNPNAKPGDYGYGYGDTPRTEEEFAARYEGLIDVLLSHPRICGFCYTQIVDVEEEQNGLYAYDRSRKFADWVYDRIRAANKKIAKIEEQAE